MRVIGVIDVQGGRAVHARSGHRADYRPVHSVAGVVIDGDPMVLAREYVERLGVRELYVADLDAIERGDGAMQADVIASIAGLRAPVWLDAGASSPDTARRALATGAAMVIVGLETLTGFAALRDVAAAVGQEAVAFSIDLRGGVPVARSNASLASTPVGALAASAQAAGVGAVIVLDLARVGTGAGPDATAIAAVRAAAPNVALFAGGGVRDVADLRRLAALGCEGALVASGLIDGRITGPAARAGTGTRKPGAVAEGATATGSRERGGGPGATGGR